MKAKLTCALLSWYFIIFILYFNFVQKNNNDEATKYRNRLTCSSCRWPYYLQSKSRIKTGHPSKIVDCVFDKKTERINVCGVAWNIRNSIKKHRNYSTRPTKVNNNGINRNSGKNKRESRPHIHRNFWGRFWVCNKELLHLGYLSSI